MAHTTTQTLTSAPSSPTTMVSVSHCSKSVQFSRFIKISFTYPCDEYDRTALEPAKLTFSEASELMQLRIDWKQDMKRRMQQEEQQQQQHQQLQHDMDSEEDGYSSDEARVPGSFSRASPRQSNACLYQNHHSSSASCGSSTILSCHGRSSGSVSDDDEYSSENRGLNTLQTSGMMHRHNELYRSKENMPCLA
ncbi:hypothetical protein KVV02_008294 [Mortierella alpina]|uniref:Uncharacterized protein n=1 Tax=Mortierella alpina TaxID=64518 RepID=A0A9P8CX85_MORAP|nr:hypothetical protein KVV02_008294 [Mortierella alpina]